MKLKAFLAAALLLPALSAVAAEAPSVERGRYLVVFGGCNDCHTDGYAQHDGGLPESQWLTGSAVGFQGPWGTSYPANLRLTTARMTEDEWLVAARARRMPPMPWFNLVALRDDDLRSMYRFVKSLGEPGKPVPAYVAPGGVVNTPVIVFVPQQPAAPAVARVNAAR